MEFGKPPARLAIGGDVEGISGKCFEGLNEIRPSQESATSWKSKMICGVGEYNILRRAMTPKLLASKS
jgi:hypothetical protein